MNGATLDGRRLYLVIDPAPGAEVVMPRVEAALRGSVDLLQVWDHWAPEQDAEGFVGALLGLAEGYGVPVLVHENPELLAATGAHGIHYDTPHPEPAGLRVQIGRPVLYGVTCGNDLQRFADAVAAGADYVSFCALFPSASAPGCELVALESVRAARRRFGLPIFASGGVTPENAAQVLAAGADGIAVISGVLGAADPQAAARRYREVLDAAAHAAGDSDP